MSEYMSFFIRRDVENFVPLFTFSRNCVIYEILRYSVPYGKISPLSYHTLENKSNECERRIKDTEDRIKRCEEERALIASFNNSVEEKMEALADNAQWLGEIKDNLEEERRALYTIIALIDIVEEIRFNDAWDKDKYIYAGIEVCSPTTKDVIEK